MQSSQPSSGKPGVLSAAALAKGALRRLATERLEPTPENYARAYRQEAGAPEGSSVLPARAQRLIDKLAARALDSDGGEAAALLSRSMADGRWDKAERTFETAPHSGGGDTLARLIERLVRGMERGGAQWTLARRKLGVQRVLESSRSDSRRLQQRLMQLVTTWESDTPGSSPVDDAAQAPGASDPGDAHEPAAPAPARDDGSPRPDTQRAPRGAAGSDEASGEAGDEADAAEAALEGTLAPSSAIPAGAAAPGRAASGKLLFDPSPKVARAPEARAIRALSGSLQQALPPDAGLPHALSAALHAQTERLLNSTAAPEVEAIERLSEDARRVLQHRHHLFDELGKLTVELTASLTDLSEDETWVRGQCEAMRAKIDEGLTPRGVRSVSDMLHTTRQRHAALRGERERARGSLKLLINRMLLEVAELGSTTGGFHESVERYAAVIDQADSLESLAGVVREMVEESRTVHTLVHQTQQRLQEEHAKASGLSQRVSELEDEMKRLSDEVSTDQLTKVANRRGLMAAFEMERQRQQRKHEPLAIGLLDIDNFKKLNDELGHAAGDEALKSLAAVISTTLRPEDRVARYGGEEFVVLLPGTAVEEGQQILTRLQRSLTGGLFLHKDKQVFVTFSAGVTAYRPGESMEAALERADLGLYEAKRTGKNRTCLG